MRACECNILASLLPPPSTLIFHVSPLGDSAGLQISIFSPFIPAVTPARSPTSTLTPLLLAVLSMSRSTGQAWSAYNSLIGALISSISARGSS